MSTHNLCFEQNMKNIRVFYLKIFHFLEVKFSIYLNRHVFVMQKVFIFSISPQQPWYGSSVEASHSGASNEYPHEVFLEKSK